MTFSFLVKSFVLAEVLCTSITSPSPTVRKRFPHECPVLCPFSSVSSSPCPIGPNGAAVVDCRVHFGPIMIELLGRFFASDMRFLRAFTQWFGSSPFNLATVVARHATIQPFPTSNSLSTKMSAAASAAVGMEKFESPRHRRPPKADQLSSLTLVRLKSERFVQHWLWSGHFA